MSCKGKESGIIWFLEGGGKIPPKKDEVVSPTLCKWAGLGRYCTRGSLSATALRASALLSCPTPRLTLADKYGGNWKRNIRKRGTSGLLHPQPLLSPTDTFAYLLLSLWWLLPPILKPTLTWLPLLTWFFERFKILIVGAICIISDRPSSWHSLFLHKFKDNSFGEEELE